MATVFLLNKKSSILFACTVEYIKNGISASVMVQFLVYLGEKQAVEAKECIEVSTQAKEVLSGVLPACFIRCWYSATVLLLD